MAITYIPVIGAFRYRDAAETPASGQRVVFLARNPAVVDGQVITLPKKLTATLTAAGVGVDGAGYRHAFLVRQRPLPH